MRKAVLACVLMTLFAGHRASSDGPARWLRPVANPTATQMLFAPYSLIAARDRLFFVANDLPNGTEVWVSDGTAPGTHLLRDVFPGPDHFAAGGVPAMDPRINPLPDKLMSAAGLLLFASSDAGPGNLWRSDGTLEGTVPVFDPLDPDGPHLPPRSTYFDAMPSGVTFGGRAFFVATRVGSGENGLWSSDGTRQGTRFLTALATTLQGRTELTPVNFGAVFQQWSSSTGYELWRSDGTPAGTRPVTSVGGAFQIVATDGRVVYLFSNSSLWRVDLESSGATFAGTFPSISYAAVLGGTLFFSVTGSGPDAGLWSSDGSPSGTQRIASRGDVFSFAALSGVLVFATQDASGVTLWRADGTPAGTQKIREFPTGNLASGARAAGGLAWLSLSVDRNAPPQIWTTDGTPDGTRAVTAGTWIGDLVSLGGLVYFFNESGELWASDGTTPGTRSVKSIGGLSSPTRARLLATDGPGAYFAEDKDAGLWRTDGTATGTRRVSSLSGKIDRAAKLGRSLLCTIQSGAATQLWSFDGANVHLVATLDIGSYGAYGTSELVPLGGFLFMAQAAFPGTVQLWRTDGTTAGTVLVEQFVPKHDSATNFPPVLERVGDRLVFQVQDPDGDTRLFATNGEPSAAVAIATLFASPSSVVISGGFAYFLQSASNRTTRLARTDGTAAGTVTLLDADVSGLTADGHGGVYFVRSDSGISSLWHSDGTPAGTSPSLLVPAGVTPVATVATIRDRLLFVGSQVSTGQEIWAANLLTGDSTLPRDIGPGGLSFDQRTWSLAPVGHGLLFAASDGLHGRELWATEGTPEGTRLVQDLNPGPGSSSPGDFLEAACGGIVYFTADVEGVGREPFAIPLSAIDPSAKPKPCPLAPAPPALARPRTRP